MLVLLFFKLFSNLCIIWIIPVLTTPKFVDNVGVLGFERNESSTNRSRSSFRKTELRTLKRKNLYVFVDKNHTKVGKTPSHLHNASTIVQSVRADPGVEFIPINFPTSHDVKISFKKLLRVMCPSPAVKSEGNLSFWGSVEDSKWLQQVSVLFFWEIRRCDFLVQVSCVLTRSCEIANLIDLYNSSVAICLEDGWDGTCQISSLVQILLDPFYRTLEGFKVCIFYSKIGMISIILDLKIDFYECMRKIKQYALLNH